MRTFVRHIPRTSAIVIGSVIMLGAVSARAGTNTGDEPISARSVDASMAADAPAAVAARRALATEVRGKLVARHIRPGRNLDAVIAAVARAPRHLLVPEKEAANAYADQILAIGYGQTSTDPGFVAYMTALLDLKKTDHVLEVGTGPGYQAAVLADIVADVHTIEIVAPLAALAAERLAGLGYANVTVRAGDGYKGWPEYGPYDAISVTAGALCVPPALVAQLRPGGRMAIPLGQSAASEELVVIHKSPSGALRAKSYGPVMFVDFTGTIEQSSRLWRFRRRGFDLRHLRMCDA